jgi:hypothetical protein
LAAHPLNKAARKRVKMRYPDFFIVKPPKELPNLPLRVSFSWAYFSELQATGFYKYHRIQKTSAVAGKAMAGEGIQETEWNKIRLAFFAFILLDSDFCLLYS